MLIVLSIEPYTSTNTLGATVQSFYTFTPVRGTVGLCLSYCYVPSIAQAGQIAGIQGIVSVGLFILCGWKETKDKQVIIAYNVSMLTL